MLTRLDDVCGAASRAAKRKKKKKKKKKKKVGRDAGPRCCGDERRAMRKKKRRRRGKHITAKRSDVKGLLLGLGVWDERRQCFGVVWWRLVRRQRRKVGSSG